MTNKGLLIQNLSFCLSSVSSLKFQPAEMIYRKEKTNQTLEPRDRYRGPDWNFIVYKHIEVRARKGKGMLDVSGEELFWVSSL